MKKLFMCLCLGACVLAGAATAADLYRVDLDSYDHARVLRESGVQPVVRLDNAYLILGETAQIKTLTLAGIHAEQLATNLSSAELALDSRRDSGNRHRFPVLFEHDDLRLLRVSPDEIGAAELQYDLIPLRTELLTFEYRPPFDPGALGKKLAALPDGLDTLIQRIEQDSLVTYLERLQAFNGRLAGSDSNYASRDWIAGKFTEFGYDSLVIDSFYHDFGSGMTSCQNVVAYKPGSVYPDHHIVVGAHRDAVMYSPGADDNGSGTVAVMEIARALAGVETEITIVFVLFDAEEFGLYGSWEYAARAYANRDNIVCMLNMDMIGYLENDHETTVYHGPDLTIPNLYNELADSLTSITGHLAGTSAYSDHYPFQQLGWPVVFVIEWEFSSVYHTYRDSTSYINYD
ncbi:M28 family peptidase, partial [candidate division GN15 bacterium]|nr:M28 family peptidase [candidate division GN15 bacterium]